jgi:hypothetical protein
MPILPYYGGRDGLVQQLKRIWILSSINLHRNRGDSTPLWNLHVEPEQECLSNAVCQTVQTLSKVLNQTDAVKQIQTLLLIF